jgi:hypothetical protein
MDDCGLSLLKNLSGFGTMPISKNWQATLLLAHFGSATGRG